MAVIEKSGLMRYRDADGNLTNMYPITKAENVFGLESTKVSTTLSAGSWSGGKYTWSNSGIKSADQIIELTPAPTINVDQLTALQTANIIGTAQAVGSVTMTAFGEVPTIDIPVVFIIRGDV